MSGWWIVGWVGGVVVVALVAVLVLAITALAQRISGQARDITTALDGAREHTEPLFAVRETNSAIDRITRGLRGVRTGGAE
jgi:Tfp pilus assembly protein PilX